MNLWETLILFFSFQAIIFGCILFLKRKGNKPAHILWGTFLFIFAYNIFFNVLYWSKINPRLLMQLQSSYILCMALYGPLFYLYIRSLVTEKKVSLKDFLHLIPFGMAVYHTGGYLFASIDIKQKIIQSNQFLDYMKLGSSFESLLVCVMMGYGIAAFLLYRKSYVNDSSNLLHWLQAIVYTYLAFCLAWAAYYLLVYMGILQIEHDYIITICMILFIAMTTYVGIEHPRIFNGKPMKELIPFIKYEKTGLSKKLSLEWKQNLDKYMVQKRPYLDGELRLDDLSEALGYSRHHTSQIINEHYGMNFFEFINLYRIREAAALLQNTNTKELQITEIAYQVGFNNRTSFYKAFNKEYGMTPSQFRKSFLHANTVS